jgi:glycosyltransferase involved in cell wall biosynthesis
MMHKNKLSLTIVIPAYNEERHLAACLDSIAAQTVAPDEVIVVNNNSTDGTTEIASRYSFVTVIHESEQGLIPARNAGFNKATAILLARINADVELLPDWVARVISDFTEMNIAGLTGPAVTKLLPSLSIWHTTLWSRIYFLMTDAFFGVPIMWGANMVITKQVWQDIRGKANPSDAVVHEDQDLSLLILSVGKRCFRDNSLLVKTDEQSYQYWPKLYEYLRRCWQTKAVHKQLGTYASTSIVRIPLGRRIPNVIVALPVSLIFVIYSLIAYAWMKAYYFVVGILSRRI